MRVVVTGTRHRHPLVERWLDAWVERHGVPELFVLGDQVALERKTGEWRGVDEQARRHCALRGWPYERTYADWRAHKEQAGPERNARMVAACSAGDVCLAFPGEASRGTWDTVRKARAAGLVVYVCPGAG